MGNTIPKGEYGYTDAHKRTQLIKTLILFLLPAAIFTIGYCTSHTRMNLFTVVAVVGCLPACKETVNLIMFWNRHSLSRELHEQIAPHVQTLSHAWELVLTTYDKNYPISSLVIRGNEVAGYTPSKEPDLRALESHIIKVLKENGLSGVHVHIFTDLKTYLERTDALGRREPEAIPFTPDERYPSLNREQLIRELILALSL